MVAELLSTTDTFNVGSSATHTATASEPSEEICTIASSTWVPTAERDETGPHEATPPEIVAELDFTASFALEEPSRHTAVALVPSLDRAILTPTACIPAVDRSTGALSVGWAMATDEKPYARRDTSRAKGRVMSELSDSRVRGTSVESIISPKDRQMRSPLEGRKNPKPLLL
jgi:hypothetical protein